MILLLLFYFDWWTILGLVYLISLVLSVFFYSFIHRTPGISILLNLCALGSGELASKKVYSFLTTTGAAFFASVFYQEVLERFIDGLKENDVAKAVMSLLFTIGLSLSLEKERRQEVSVMKKSKKKSRARSTL